MTTEPRILIAEDEERLRRLLGILLGDRGYKLTLAEHGAEALEFFCNGTFDLVITDLKMPEMDGMELLRAIKQRAPETPVIVITAFGSIDNAVEAMRDGAIDYITKPFEEEKIKLAITRALNFGNILNENRNLRREIRDKFNIGNIIAESPGMKQAIETARQVAASNTTVLILGESGTGKELITRAIHDFSPRSRGPFVAINCAAIPDALLESELFGHERGAFTGATDRKIGRFEMANGGSLFLDEIGEMSSQIQAKVLRAIETQEFERVGGTKTIKTDVRFLAATNKDLRRCVAEGTFREDLYFRINVFPVTLPPLRERPEDILPLARFFLEKFSREMGRKLVGVSVGAEKALLGHGWPGNVRELQNTIERATIVAQGPELQLEALGLAASSERGGGGEAEFVIPASGFSLDDHEKALLLQALLRSRGNKTKAAALLGISRATLRYRLEKFAIGSVSSED